MLCTFSLRNVLRATTACTFSTSQLPKVVRTWCVLYILTWKCASRHNGVQFFISSVQQKHSVSRLSYVFARLHLLSSDSFSSLIFSLLLFFSILLLHLCFSSVHIVGSLTSKLSSTSIHIHILRPDQSRPHQTRADKPDKPDRHAHMCAYGYMHTCMLHAAYIPVPCLTRVPSNSNPRHCQGMVWAAREVLKLRHKPCRR